MRRRHTSLQKKLPRPVSATLTLLISDKIPHRIMISSHLRKILRIRTFKRTINHSRRLKSILHPFHRYHGAYNALLTKRFANSSIRISILRHHTRIINSMIHNQSRTNRSSQIMTILRRYLRLNSRGHRFNIKVHKFNRNLNSAPRKTRNPNLQKNYLILHKRYTKDNVYKIRNIIFSLVRSLNNSRTINPHLINNLHAHHPDQRNNYNNHQE